MCRVLFAKAEGNGVDLVRKLIYLHTKASMNDPLLADLTGGDGRHCHGFGSILLVDRGGGWEFYYHRFDAATKARDEEESCRLNLERLRKHSTYLASLVKDSRRIMLLLHSRRASRGMPRGLLNAHPFNAGITSGSYSELYLAHNGSVYHERMAMELGLDPKSYTDSHILTLWIAKKLGEGLSLVEALREGAGFVKRAYIVGALLVDGIGEPSLAYAGVLADGLDGLRQRYYRSFLAYSDEVTALISPTIKMYAVDEGLDLEYRVVDDVGLL